MDPRGMRGLPDNQRINGPGDQFAPAHGMALDYACQAAASLAIKNRHKGEFE
jgi:hypothetical protein